MITLAFICLISCVFGRNVCKYVLEKYYFSSDSLLTAHASRYKQHTAAAAVANFDICSSNLISILARQLSGLSFATIRTGLQTESGQTLCLLTLQIFTVFLNFILV
jgi:hypothetical protein